MQVSRQVIGIEPELVLGLICLLTVATNGAESFLSKEALNPEIAKDKTLAVVMGGGAGTRLFPLTLSRDK